MGSGKDSESPTRVSSGNCGASLRQFPAFGSLRARLIQNPGVRRMSGMSSMLRIALDRDASPPTSRMKGERRSGRYHPEKLFPSFRALREESRRPGWISGCHSCRSCVRPLVLDAYSVSGDSLARYELVPPQRTNRIEPRRTTRRKPRRERTGAEQHQRDRRERERVGRRNAVEQRLRQHAQRHRRREAHRQADRAHQPRRGAQWTRAPTTASRLTPCGRRSPACAAPSRTRARRRGRSRP